MDLCSFTLLSGIYQTITHYMYNWKSLAETYPAVHNSQLGPGRTADWVDGVVGKVYMYITGCVSARRVYSACVCVSVYPTGSGGRD